MPDRRGRVRTDDPLKRQIEYRAFRAAALRAPGDDGAAGFDGYASTFWHVDSYGTAFAPGAYAKSLAERRERILVLWQHDPYLPIGKPTAMEEDEAGLAVTARITEGTQYGRDAMALLRDEIPLGLSVGFRTMRERPATDDDPLVLGADVPKLVATNLPDSVWVIEEVKLYEFSVVSFPANEHAEIAAVRADAQAEALATLLSDVRAGRVAEAHRPLVSELVAAWQAAPAGMRPGARADSKAPRRIDADVALAQWGYLLERTA